MDHFNATDPAFPCDDFDPSEEEKFFGLTKMDYAMIHISAALAASGRFDLMDDTALKRLQGEAYNVACDALIVSENI